MYPYLSISRAGHYALFKKLELGNVNSGIYGMRLKVAMFKTEVEAYGGTTRLIVEYIKRSKHMIDIYSVKVATNGLVREALNGSNVYYIYEWDSKQNSFKIMHRFVALKKIIKESYYDVILLLIGPIFSETPLIRNYQIPVIVYIQGAFRFLDYLRYKTRCFNNICEAIGYVYGIYLKTLLSSCLLYTSPSPRDRG